jgi:hypothetical protein
MLAVLASRHDPDAEALLARWGDRAALLSCEDLSIAGWRFEPDYPSDGTAVVAGVVVAVADLEGVLTLRPSIFEDELVHMAPEDRPYAAAEMNAFLLAWLTALPCRVVNRPSSTSLLGPHWRREQWIRAAASLAIPAAPSRRTSRVSAGGGSADHIGPTGGSAVLVVGERGFGDVAPELVDRAMQLARYAGADLLEVWFENAGATARLLDASPYTPLQDPAAADALLELIVDQPVQPGGVA